jgi:hypothetical protein
MAFLLRQLGFVAVAAMACLYAVVVLKGPTGFPAMMEKWHEVQSMRENNDALRHEIEQKRIAIEQLQHNQAARDHVVRESTGKTPPGDLTIIVPKETDKR